MAKVSLLGSGAPCPTCEAGSILLFFRPLARTNAARYGPLVARPGQSRSSSGRFVDDTCSQSFKFTGKYRDSETGNDYFGARYYTSSFGRFLSPDWSAKVEPVPYAKLDNPQTLNLYLYAGDNPESVFDPDGHDGKKAAGYQTVRTGQCTMDSPCGHKKVKVQAQSQNPAVAALHGKILPGTVTVFHTTKVTTMAADGSYVTTETTTAATFSTAKGTRGEFLGAATRTDKWGDGYVPTTIHAIGPGEAIRAMGPGLLEAGAAAAFPSRAGYFIRSVVHDAEKHPAVYAMHAAGLALPYLGVGEAAEGLITGAEALKTAFDLKEEMQEGPNQ